MVSFTLCSHSSRCLEELNLNRCIVRCWKTIKIFYNKRSLQIFSQNVAQFSQFFDSFMYSVHTPERILKVYLRQEFFSKTSFLSIDIINIFMFMFNSLKKKYMKKKLYYTFSSSEGQYTCNKLVFLDFTLFKALGDLAEEINSNMHNTKRVPLSVVWRNANETDWNRVRYFFLILNNIIFIKIQFFKFFF